MLTAAAGIDPSVGGTAAIVYPASPSWPGSDRYSLAVGPNGSMYLSWLEPVGSAFWALKFSTLSTRGWTVPRAIAEEDDWTDTWGDVPRVVPQDDGALLAHWLQNRGLPGDRMFALRVVRSSDGVHWQDLYRGRPELKPTWPRFMSVIRDRGDATGVFLREHDYGFALHVRTFGRVTRPGVDLPPHPLDSCDSMAAVTVGDTTSVAFRHRGHDGDVSLVQLRQGAWTAPTALDSAPSVDTGCSAPPPAVAAEGETLAAAWLSAGRLRPSLRVVLSHDRGTTALPAIAVDEGRPMGQPGLLVLDDRSAVVAWIESGHAPSHGRLCLRRVLPDGRLGALLHLATLPATPLAGVPQLARTGDTLALAWRDDRVRTALVPLDLLAPVER